MPYSSVDSYKVFKKRAWGLLKGGAYAKSSMETISDDLYDKCYCEPKVNSKASNKSAIKGKALIKKMRQILAAYGNGRKVLIQGTRQWLDLDKLAEEYKNRYDYLDANFLKRAFCAADYQGSKPLSDKAQDAATIYLHTYADPIRNTANVNWRLVANVKPESLDGAVQDACDILDNKPDVIQFKISPPGFVGKPDSTILYVQNKLGSYANIRDTFKTSMSKLKLQKTSAPMVNELDAGIGECSEPPSIRYENPNGPQQKKHQYSFGTYRCFLTAMAYRSALKSANTNNKKLTENDFGVEVDTIFNRYGVPAGNPHMQNPVNYMAQDDAYIQFTEALDNYYNLPSGTFADMQATFINPPAIV